jgi:hypothetical protein
MNCGYFHLDGIEDVPINYRNLASNTYVSDANSDRALLPPVKHEALDVDSPDYGLAVEKGPKPTELNDPLSMRHNNADVFRTELKKWNINPSELAKRVEAVNSDGTEANGLLKNPLLGFRPFLLG